ncbi:MAG: hypothetical protein AAF902_20500 [Chloroflexota bacterium]
MGIGFTGQKYSLAYYAREDRDPVKIWTQMNEFMLQFGEEYVFKIRDGIEIDVSSDGLTKMYQSEKEKREKKGDFQPSSTDGAWSENHLYLGLSTGVTAQFANSLVKLPEVFKFKLDLAHIYSTAKVFEFIELQAFFKMGAMLFNPYYGRLQKFGEASYSESAYDKKFNSIDLSKVPPVIEWFNYFSPSWVERFGGKQFVMSAPVFHAEKVEETGGVILILQEEPFDFMNNEHMNKRKQVEEYLNLPELHKQYQK